MDVMPLRTSERRAFRRCPQRWWWGYRDGLDPIDYRANALWFGTGIHLALAERYKYTGLRRGRNVLKVWRDYVGDEMAYVATRPPTSHIDDKPKWEEAGALGEAMLGAYLDKYGRDERWYWIATEQTFTKVIKAKGITIKYHGTWDGAARDEESEHGDTWLFEHKSAKAIMTNHLALDDQGGSYWMVANEMLYALGLISATESLEGIMYNFLRKSTPDPRPRNAEGSYLNQNGSVSKKQPAQAFVREPVYRTGAEQLMQKRRIIAESRAMMKFRTGELDLYKNSTTDCSWDCGFYAMCELHENGDDWEEFADVMMKVRDPYEDHRKSASEGVM